jgi:ubiquitin-activating enzyme E1 C
MLSHLCLQFIKQLIADNRFSGKLSKPSISHQGENLYMAAPPVLEEMTRENLSKPLAELLGGKGGTVNVNDKKLAGVLRVQVTFNDAASEPADMDTARAD